MRISDWSSDVCSSDLFDALDYQGVFTPPSLKGTLEYPGLGGDINWGSVSVDPVHRRMSVNLQTAPFKIKLVPRAQSKGAMDGGGLVAVGPPQGPPNGDVRGPFLWPREHTCQARTWGTEVEVESGR